MQFVSTDGGRDRKQRTLSTRDDSLLSLYRGAIRHEVTIGDFEVFALGRLRGACARGILHAQSRGVMRVALRVCSAEGD